MNMSTSDCRPFGNFSRLYLFFVLFSYKLNFCKGTRISFYPQNPQRNKCIKILTKTLQTTKAIAFCDLFSFIISISKVVYSMLKSYWVGWQASSKSNKIIESHWQLLLFLLLFSSFLVFNLSVKNKKLYIIYNVHAQAGTVYVFYVYQNLHYADLRWCEIWIILPAIKIIHNFLLNSSDRA